MYYELHPTMLAAIAREKQIKGGSRADKLRLIERMNPEWADLAGLGSGEMGLLRPVAKRTGASQ